MWIKKLLFSGLLVCFIYVTDYNQVNGQQCHAWLTSGGSFLWYNRKLIKVVFHHL